MAKTTPKGNIQSVQVPGETASSEEQKPEVTEQSGEDASAAGDDVAAASGAEASGVAKPTSQPHRRDYINMRAHEIDPKTLTKSVLSKDGWVCPPKITKPGQE